MITENDVLNNILSDMSLSVQVLDIDPLPKPHIPVDKEKIKAFVLGADPSNFSDGVTKKIQIVFDINGDKRYFSIIKRNLSEIGLSLENVFVQNMVRNYMKNETQRNKSWAAFAEKWLPYIKQEFDLLDPDKKIPVFVTAEKILSFLVSNKSEIGKLIGYYNGDRIVPIQSVDNKLERNLIPFFRHYRYSLKTQANEPYKNIIIKLFE